MGRADSPPISVGVVHKRDVVDGRQLPPIGRPPHLVARLFARVGARCARSCHHAPASAAPRGRPPQRRKRKRMLSRHGPRSRREAAHWCRAEGWGRDEGGDVPRCLHRRRAQPASTRHHQQRRQHRRRSASRRHANQTRCARIGGPSASPAQHSKECCNCAATLPPLETRLYK